LSCVQGGRDVFNINRHRLHFSLEFSNRSGRSSTRPVRLCADLISLPQNDFRHVGHVGADGTIFGDLGLVSRAFSDLERGQSPTDSCLTLESNSDKENPRLSDITLSEFSSCDTDRDGWMETSKWSSRPPTDKTSPLSSPMENKLFPRSAVGDPVAKTIRPPSPPASSGALEGGGEEPSLFDMGSSFMDEVFKCFSLSVSDTVDTSLQSAPINTKPSCHAEVTQPERIPVYDDVVPTVESTSSVSNTSPRMQSSSPPAPAILAPLTRDSPIQRTCLKKTDVTSMAPAEISPSSPSISSRASPPSASHCAPPQGFVSNTLTRALRKTSLRNTSLTRRGRVSSAVSLEQQPEEGVANISPPVSGRSSASRKSKRSLEKSAPAKPQKPIISGPIVISGPVVLDNGTIVANPTHLLSARPLQQSAEESSSHGSISQGSSLTVISAPSSSSSGIPPTLSNSQHQKRSSPWVDDSKSVTSSERSVGGHLQPGHQPASSISTTPSISPAPSLSSMGSSLAAATAVGPSLRPMTGGTGASSGIRALRDKDAVFRATTATCSNLPASRRRVFHSQALPPPSELLNSRGRLSVSDAAPHFSLAVGTSATGFRASRMDTVSMDAATSRRALTSETGDTASPVSPSSSSLLMDSGIMAAATSSPLAEVAIHSTNTDSDHRRPHAVCEDASTRGTADLSFWGPDLVGFLCGSGSLAANECSQVKPIVVTETSALAFVFYRHIFNETLAGAPARGGSGKTVNICGVALNSVHQVY
uniref:CRIB domain-containing protein n=1 Tax=Schistocephalus solidus TaxID=70667 RepID=A0A183T5H8_SCHSO